MPRSKQTEILDHTKRSRGIPGGRWGFSKMKFFWRVARVRIVAFGVLCSPMLENCQTGFRVRIMKNQTEKDVMK